MVNAVKARGGMVTQLDTRDKQGFIASVNKLFDGHLPVGALVNGCLYRHCSGEGGDGHIAILGHTDEDGVVYLRLTGACGTCPSSVTTLKMGIERLLIEEIPEVNSVENVDPLPGA